MRGGDATRGRGAAPAGGMVLQHSGYCRQGVWAPKNPRGDSLRRCRRSLKKDFCPGCSVACVDGSSPASACLRMRIKDHCHLLIGAILQGRRGFALGAYLPIDRHPRRRKESR